MCHYHEYQAPTCHGLQMTGGMRNSPKHAKAPLTSGIPYLSEICWLLPACRGKSETSVLNRGRGDLQKAWAIKVSARHSHESMKLDVDGETYGKAAGKSDIAALKTNYNH